MLFPDTFTRLGLRTSELAIMVDRFQRIDASGEEGESGSIQFDDLVRYARCGATIFARR